MKGWLKQSLNEEGVTQMEFTLHVSSFQMNGPLSAYQRGLICDGGCLFHFLERLRTEES